MPLNLLAHYLYRGETTLERQAIETARTSVSRTFVKLLVPAASPYMSGPSTWPNRPVLGAEIRTDDRATAAPVPSASEQSLASRRDGSADRRRADVSLACRRPRGRGPRHAGSAASRQSSGAAADAQAAQEARLR